MDVRGFACVVVLLGVGGLPDPVWAQRSGDQARLIFTASGGVVAGKRLWSASPQAAQFVAPADSFALGRRIRSNIAIGFAGTYFPGENLGVTVEGFLVGLGFEDSCTHLFSSGSGDAAATCQSLQGATKAATSVILSGGPVFRINSRKLFSPYARAYLGLVFSNQSSIRMIGRFPGALGRTDYIIYDDDNDTRVEPALGIGAGFTAAIAKGYQLRLEARDNIVGVQRVTGTTPLAGDEPPHEVDYKHLFSLTIGFDVVLERRRGRRY